MNIAIVGGGIFGTVMACKIAEEHTVHLYEQHKDILQEASDVNQCRIHRGYHYPRSNLTTSSVIKAENSFIKYFSNAVMKNTDNYYCISKEGSFTSATKYIAFCKQFNLEFEPTKLDIINPESIDLCVKVNENLFDHALLKKDINEKLEKNGVHIHLSTKASADMLKQYDHSIVSTYSNNNSLLEQYPKFQKNYQFELCEKVFVKLPISFHQKSVLIMDGPFMSIDPVGSTGSFIIGDVVNTVIQQNVGKYPVIDERYIKLLNKGIIKNPEFTNFPEFIKSGKKFFPELDEAKYLGSSFSIKTVLPNIDKTDDRPTVVEQINDKMTTVFSGKILTCVDTADYVNKIINRI